MHDDRPELTKSDIEALASARRILVLGPSGAGKTRLTLQLSELLGIDAIHLDREFWKDGWISTPQTEWQATVAALAQRESWVMDGTYESTLKLRVRAADAIIFVDDSVFLRLYRVLIRRFGGGDATRPDAPPGQTIDLPYLRYILFFSRDTMQSIRQFLQHCDSQKVFITLSGRHEIEYFLRELRRFGDEKCRADTP